MIQSSDIILIFKIICKKKKWLLFKVDQTLDEKKNRKRFNMVNEENKKNDNTSIYIILTDPRDVNKVFKCTPVENKKLFSTDTFS